MKDEILFFKASVAKGETLQTTKTAYLKAKQTFTELQTLTDEYQMQLKEIMDSVSFNNKEVPSSESNGTGSFYL